VSWTVRHSLHIRAALLGAAFFLCGATGCVTSVEQRKPAAQANLFITRSSAGVELTWESVKGQVYSVQMKDRNKPGAKWDVHPQAFNFIGTGGRMTLKDVPPPGVVRQYRLHLLPIEGIRAPGPPAAR
jgi:hypothetical protein